VREMQKKNSLKNLKKTKNLITNSGRKGGGGDFFNPFNPMGGRQVDAKEHDNQKKTLDAGEKGKNGLAF